MRSMCRRPLSAPSRPAASRSSPVPGPAAPARTAARRSAPRDLPPALHARTAGRPLAPPSWTAHRLPAPLNRTAHRLPAPLNRTAHRLPASPSRTAARLSHPAPGPQRRPSPGHPETARRVGRIAAGRGHRRPAWHPPGRRPARRCRRPSPDGSAAARPADRRAVARGHLADFPPAGSQRGGRRLPVPYRASIQVAPDRRGRARTDRSGPAGPCLAVPPDLSTRRTSGAGRVGRARRAWRRPIGRGLTRRRGQTHHRFPARRRVLTHHRFPARRRVLTRHRGRTRHPDPTLRQVWGRPNVTHHRDPRRC